MDKEIEKIQQESKSLLSKALKWVVLAIFTGGGTISLQYMSPVWRGFMDAVVSDLDTTYNIQPLPSWTTSSLLEITREKRRLDSLVVLHDSLTDIYGYYMNYQNELNLNVLLGRCGVAIVDGIEFHVDTCQGVNWKVYNGFVYQGIKRGGNWYIRLFPWQVNDGSTGEIMLTREF